MKKLLFVLALGVFAACGNAENKEAATDSTAVAPVSTDSAATATPDSAAATTAHAKCQLFLSATPNSSLKRALAARVP